MTLIEHHLCILQQVLTCDFWGRLSLAILGCGAVLCLPNSPGKAALAGATPYPINDK